MNAPLRAPPAGGSGVAVTFSTGGKPPRVSYVPMRTPRDTIRERFPDMPKAVHDFVYDYAHGKCAVLALALCNMLGIQDVVCVYNEERYVHFCVEWNGRLLDSYGPTTLREIRERYGDKGLRALVMPAEELSRRIKSEEALGQG